MYLEQAKKTIQRIFEIFYQEANADPQTLIDLVDDPKIYDQYLKYKNHKDLALCMSAYFCEKQEETNELEAEIEERGLTAEYNEYTRIWDSGNLRGQVEEAEEP